MVSSQFGLCPAITTHKYLGHTAGHTVYALENKNQKLVFWGNRIPNSAIQLSDAEILNEYDVDKAKAIIQRKKKAYPQAAADSYLIAAAHISFPGIGHLRTQEKGYSWVPVNFSLDN